MGQTMCHEKDVTRRSVMSGIMGMLHTLSFEQFQDNFFE